MQGIAPKSPNVPKQMQSNAPKAQKPQKQGKNECSSFK
jgi:hypothetical protein